MRTITVNKPDLIETLRTNRDAHAKDYEIAWTAYRHQVEDELITHLETIQNAEVGDDLPTMITLSPPENHLDDYDRALEMLEWDIDPQVSLDQQEFRNFVQDQWSWKYGVEALNAFYTGSASPSKL